MLEVIDLRKTYGKLTAVQGVTFELMPGDVFGFIGSNGAGKTTTIRMLATLLEPSSGTARLNGIDIVKHPMAVRTMLGYMPDFFGLYDDIKVWEYLDYFARLYRVKKNNIADKIDEVLTLTQLTVKRNDYVQNLSRGMQQRLCLARCLIHDPALLLLDEPASGLDPRARSELKDLISTLAGAGKIVLVSSHILPELADFCNKVGIIERGKLLEFGGVDEIVERTRPERTLRLQLIDRSKEAMGWLEAVVHVHGLHSGTGHEIRFKFGGSLQDQAEMVAGLVHAGFAVVGLKDELFDLEDVFLQITTGAVQ